MKSETGREAMISPLPFLSVILVSSAASSTLIPFFLEISMNRPIRSRASLVSAVFFEWTGVRSGGFLTAAYAALFVLQPLHLFFIMSIGVLVFYFVTRFLMRRTPIFGRTKFAMMVLTALTFTWALEVLTGALTRNLFIPFAGFSVISPMIAALIANDGERQGLRKTLLGMIVTTLIVFIAIKGVDLLLIG